MTAPAGMKQGRVALMSGEKGIKSPVS